MKKPFILFIVLVAVGLSILIWKAPRTPKPGEAALAIEEYIHSDESDEIIEKALELLESGEGSPMEAIGMIREILEKNPKHIRANLVLGSLSFQTGQYDRAIQRMRVIYEVQPNNQDAILILGESYAAKQNIDSARYFYETLLELEHDENDTELINSKLKKLLTP